MLHPALQSGYAVQSFRKWCRLKAKCISNISYILDTAHINGPSQLEFFLLLLSTILHKVSRFLIYTSPYLIPELYVDRPNHSSYQIPIAIQFIWAFVLVSGMLVLPEVSFRIWKSLSVANKRSTVSPLAHQKRQRQGGSQVSQPIDVAWAQWFQGRAWVKRHPQ